MDDRETPKRTVIGRLRDGRFTKLMDVGAVAGSRIARQAILVLVMAIAARILGKELLGTWAILYIVIQFGVLVSDSGISTFIVRQKALGARLYGTAFLLSTTFAVLVAAMVAAAGTPIASLLGYGQHAVHLMAASAAIIPMTVNGLIQAKLRRDRRFHVILVADICGSLVLLFLAVVMLIQGAGLWALIVPTIVSSLVSAALCSMKVGLPRMRFNRADARKVVDYSLGLVGFASVNYWARNADHLLIGRFLGAAPLGVYSFAYRIMMLPLSQIVATAQLVALPYLSPHQDDPERLRVSMRQITVVIGMLATLPMTWIWLERDLIVRVALGEDWAQVGDLLAVLAPVAVLQALINPIGLCYQVTGETKKFFAIGMVHTLSVVCSFALGVWLGSIEWVVICYAVANIAMVPISVITGLGTIGGRLRDWLTWSSPFFVCLGLSWMAVNLMPIVDSDWGQASLTLVATSFVSLPGYLYAFRTTFTETTLSSFKNAELLPAQPPS